MDIIQNIFSIDISGIIIFLKIISALLIVGFIGGIIFSYFGKQKINEEFDVEFNNHFIKPAVRQQETSPQQKHWLKLEQMFRSKDPHAWRLAIIDADTMLEEFIDSLGYQGMNLGEKLKNMHYDNVPWLQAAWDVHLLRNKLAHEGTRYPLNEREAYRAYKIYENIFKENGYLA
jgi:hypothetical protein